MQSEKRSENPCWGDYDLIMVDEWRDYHNPDDELNKELKDIVYLDLGKEFNNHTSCYLLEQLKQIWTTIDDKNYLNIVADWGPGKGRETKEDAKKHKTFTTGDGGWKTWSDGGYSPEDTGPGKERFLN